MFVEQVNKQVQLKSINQASFDHVKFGVTPVLALHIYCGLIFVEKVPKLSVKLL